MTSKIYTDSEFGDITLHKNIRSRCISIRVRSASNGSRISVTLPWSLRYRDGIEYMKKRREWIRSAIEKQAEKARIAAENGKSVCNIGNGTVVNTLLTKFVFRAEDIDENTLTIRTARVENPEDSRRLWLSPDYPFTVKSIGFPDIPGLELELKESLIRLLREEAKLLLPEKAAFFAAQYGFKFRKIIVKNNKTNWGSCSSAGNINLNISLVRLPEPLCDYVILHELCHLKEPNHGPRFHSLLDRLCVCNIRHLIDIGSPDALKYKQFSEGQHLDEVLSREIRKWRIIL